VEGSSHVRILIAISNRPVRRARSANERNGVEKVIRALAQLKTTHPRKKKLFPSLLGFAATVTACAMPKRKPPLKCIGSRVQDAGDPTDETLGMRWRHAGGQAILTLRALHQSERFERAWKLLSSTATRTVEIRESVVAVS
jgi:hypothetical protein